MGSIQTRGHCLPLGDPAGYCLLHPLAYCQLLALRLVGLAHAVGGVRITSKEAKVRGSSIQLILPIWFLNIST